jgi:glyoxylase-like metal-dependent hydrolase (beta-lactamase superfamily II)
MTSDPTDRLYFRQLLAGRDIARTDPIARQMVNFVYLVGGRETGEAVVIDAAYDVAGILDVLAGTLIHRQRNYHQDHVVAMMGHGIEASTELLALDPVPARPGRRHRGCCRSPGSRRPIWTHEGDVVMVGDIPIEPPRRATPGQPVLFIDNRLVAGDTLFWKAGC